MRTVLVMASNASEIFVKGISDLVVIFGQASPKGSVIWKAFTAVCK
jgi:hypothetical protein